MTALIVLIIPQQSWEFEHDLMIRYYEVVKVQTGQNDTQQSYTLDLQEQDGRG